MVSAPPRIRGVQWGVKEHYVHLFFFFKWLLSHLAFQSSQMKVFFHGSFLKHIQTTIPYFFLSFFFSFNRRDLFTN